MIRTRDWKLPLIGMALLLPGCSGVMWVNFTLLVVTVAIFVGTLSLGRRSEIARSTGDQSGEASRS